MDVCQKRLRLSWKVDECTPLPATPQPLWLQPATAPPPRAVHLPASRLE